MRTSVGEYLDLLFCTEGTAADEKCTEFKKWYANIIDFTLKLQI